MINLDDVEAIKKIDQGGMLTNLNEFPDQLEAAWQQVTKFALPSHYIKHDHIILCGIGPSITAGEILVDLVNQSAKSPFLIYKDSSLPHFVDHRSLVIAVSYSGNDLEPVVFFDQAGRKFAKLLAISVSGGLESLTRKYRTPFLKITYGATPQAAIGYLLAMLIGIAAKLDYLKLNHEQFTEIINNCREFQTKLKPESPAHANLAKQIAKRIENKNILIVAAPNLKGIAARAELQLNLTGRIFSTADSIPNAFSNKLIGLEMLKQNKENLIVLTLDSQYLNSKLQHKQKILFEVLEKFKINYESVSLPTQDFYSEVLQFTMLIDYVSYYSAVYREIDPEQSIFADFINDRLEQMM